MERWVILKIQKRRPDFSFRRLYIFPFRNTEAFLKGVAVPACTHSNRDFLYSEDSQRRQSPVSIQLSFHHHVAPQGRDAVRFFVGWLFLHRRLRSRQRGSAVSPEGKTRAA